MLTWSDIRAIDSIADPLGVVSVYVDRPDNAGGRLVRAVALAGELRRLEQDVARDGRAELVSAYRDCLPRIRPALARMLDGTTPGRALFAPLSTEEVFEIGVGLPVGMTAALERTAYVRPLVAAFDEGRPAGVMVAGATTAQLFEWRMGVVEEVGECRFAGAPAPVAAGGSAACRSPCARGARDLRRAGLDDASWSPATGGWPIRSPATRCRPDAMCRWSAARSRACGHAGSPPSSAPTCTMPSAGTSAAWSSGSSTPPCRIGPPCSARGGRSRRSRSAGSATCCSTASATTAGREPSPEEGAGGRRHDPAEALIELALHTGADITPLEGGSRTLLFESDGVAAVLRS